MKKLHILIIIFGIFSSTFAQDDGTIDNSFLPNNDGQKGASSKVFSIAEQADGKILLGGSFETYNGIEKNRLVRVNADGSMDTTFNQTFLASSGSASVDALAIQPDGKIIVGGIFTVVTPFPENDIIAQDIMRLNTDGTRDTGFMSGIPAFGCGDIYSISIQDDGKIILAGDISFCANNTIDNNENILRLNADGSIDTTFTAIVDGSTFDTNISKTIIQPDGKIIVAGIFDDVNGTPTNNLARLNPDGSTDSSFNTGTGFDDDVYDIKLQNDGKIVVAGDFNLFNGSPQNKLVRLNGDGSVDTSFSSGSGTGRFQPSNGFIAPRDVETVSIQNDGKIIIGGNFNRYNGIPVSKLTRLESNGSLDTSYNNVDDLGNSVASVTNSLIYSDGNIIAVGGFDNFNNYKKASIVKLTSSGNIDFNFNVTSGPSNGYFNTKINKVKKASGNKIYVAGRFGEYDDILSRNLARVNTDGTIDTSFSTGTNQSNGFDDEVLDFVEQADGKVIVVGEFENYNQNTAPGIARLNADGSIDNTFNVGTGVDTANNERINTIVQLASGKLLVGGFFNQFNGFTTKHLVRLNANGSVDTTFSVSDTSQVYHIHVMGNDQFFISVFDYNGETITGRLAKINADGTRDTTFNATGISTGTTEIVKELSNGQFIVGGFYSSQGPILKLNTDGSLDTTFTATDIGSSSNTNGRINDIKLQNDGKIIIGGKFREIKKIDNTLRTIRGVARLNADGSFDETFNPEDLNQADETYSGINDISSHEILNMELLSSGRLLVVGEFFRYNDQRKTPLIALNAGNPVAGLVTIPDPNFEQFLIDEGIDTDGTLNTQMSETDALGVTSLIMNNLNISDLTGIEAFLDLEILTAVNNNIISLNLSQNTSLTSVILIQNNLTTLDVSNNTNLSTLNLTSNAITSLDLTNNTALTILNLQNNVLTSIDTSMLVNLEQFVVLQNNITTLDLSQNINLIQIECSQNNLSELNVQNGNNTAINGTFFNASNNPNLTCITVDDIAYSETNWFQVDAQTSFSTDCDASFINIPDPNFEQVLIDDGIDTDGIINGQMLESDALGVIDLDVSSQNISDLTGIEFFTDLEELSAFNNNLTSIDLSQNANLISALLALNNLSSIDLSNNPNLISISLNDNNLSSLDLSNNLVLLQVFVNNNNLSSLDVSMHSNLENLGVAENNLIDLDISQNPNLFTLFCNGNQLQSLNVQNGNNSNFTNLEAQNNPDLECIQVDDVSFSNTNWLSAAPQFNFDAQMFFSFNCSTLINIPDPNFEQALIDLFIDSDGIINGQMLEIDALGVTSLDVTSKNISDLTGIEFFLDLETLFANDNNLNIIDLSSNITLDGLILGANNLTSIDLSNNTNLVSLVLAQNQISTIDLSNNTALTQVFIQDNLLTEFDASILPELSELNISQNDLTQLDLTQNPNLGQLLASENNLINLNLQNGNNSTIPNNFFNVTQNDNLFCIQVDDINYSTSTWTNLDAQSFFGLDCAPSNDDCSDAQSITLGQDIPSTTQSSTSSNNNPGCQDAGLIIVDVWFQFMAPASGSVTLTLNAGTFTLKSALYENCSDLTPIACGDNGLQVDNLNPGQTYYVQTWVEADLSGLLPQNDLTEVGDFTIKIDDTSTLSSFEFSNFEASFKMYPNPAQTYVTLDANQSFNGFEIYSINGKKLLSQSHLNTQNHSVDVSQLSKGIYLIKVSDENSTLTQKLIIK
jgi:uncharacterized delta-60 repeat protein